MQEVWSRYTEMCIRDRRGTLKIVKTSSDGKVKGFAFRVTGANGYDMTFETDKNGEIVIERCV